MITFALDRVGQCTYRSTYVRRRESIRTVWAGSIRTPHNRVSEVTRFCFESPRNEGGPAVKLAPGNGWTVRFVADSFYLHGPFIVVKNSIH